MNALTKNLGAVGGGVLAVGLVAVLAIADASRFEDAEYSPLYKATLEDAYSKFKESDRKVPAKGGDNAAEAMIAPAQGQPAGMGQMPAMGGRAAWKPGAAGSPGMAAAGSVPAAPVDDGGVHMKLGNEHLAKGEFPQAIEEYRVALQENPERSLAAHQIADALKYSGRYDEAVAAYLDVIKKFPTYICCYTHIGDIYRDRKEMTKADEYYDKATGDYIAQIKGGGQQGVIAKFHLAKLYIDRGRNQPEAVTLSESLVAEASDQAMYFQLLAQSYEAVGRKQDAVAAIEKAIKLNPPNVEMFEQYRQRLQSGATPTAPPAGS